MLKITDTSTTYGTRKLFHVVGPFNPRLHSWTAGEQPPTGVPFVYGLAFLRADLTWEVIPTAQRAPRSGRRHRRFTAAQCVDTCAAVLRRLEVA